MVDYRSISKVQSASSRHKAGEKIIGFKDKSMSNGEAANRGSEVVGRRPERSPVEPQTRRRLAFSTHEHPPLWLTELITTLQEANREAYWVTIIRCCQFDSSLWLLCGRFARFPLPIPNTTFWITNSLRVTDLRKSACDCTWRIAHKPQLKSLCRS